MSGRDYYSAKSFQFLRDLQYNEDGTIADGTVCPWCHQPRPGDSFLMKEEDSRVCSRCLPCRRKYGRWA